MCAIIAGGMRCVWHVVITLRRLGRDMCGSWQDLVHAAHRLRPHADGLPDAMRRQTIWRHCCSCGMGAQLCRVCLIAAEAFALGCDQHPAMRSCRIIARRTDPGAMPARQPPNPRRQTGIAGSDASGPNACLYRASYGGYAALMGVAKEPTLYRCAAGYVGVYDLDMMARDTGATRVGQRT